MRSPTAASSPIGWSPSRAPRPRAEAFAIQPNVLIDNNASNRFTVVEVNARDRPALLNQLAHALFQSKVTIHSAHVATYGERAVDTFYVTDLTGDKLDNAGAAEALERRLPTRPRARRWSWRREGTRMPVLGIGGLFFRARDPDALNAWYREHLGVGAGCCADATDAATNGLGGAGRADGVRAVQGGHRLFRRGQAVDAQPARQRARRPARRLRAAGIEVITKPEWDDPATGRFARIHDPEGNAIELWQPPA